MPEPIKSDYLDQTSTVKIIAMMETEPLTDTFEPIILSYEQHKVLRRLLESFMIHINGSFQVFTNHAHRVKLSNVRDDYTTAEIIALLEAGKKQKPLQ